jgi:hypothetical protein
MSYAKNYKQYHHPRPNLYAKYTQIWEKCRSVIETGIEVSDVHIIDESSPFSQMRIHPFTYNGTQYSSINMAYSVEIRKNLPNCNAYKYTNTVNDRYPYSDYIDVLGFMSKNAIRIISLLYEIVFVYVDTHADVSQQLIANNCYFVESFDPVFGITISGNNVYGAVLYAVRAILISNYSQYRTYDEFMMLRRMLMVDESIRSPVIYEAVVQMQKATEWISRSAIECNQSSCLTFKTNHISVSASLDVGVILPDNIYMTCDADIVAEIAKYTINVFASKPADISNNVLSLTYKSKIMIDSVEYMTIADYLREKIVGHDLNQLITLLLPIMQADPRIMISLLMTTNKILKLTNCVFGSLYCAILMMYRRNSTEKHPLDYLGPIKFDVSKHKDDNTFANVSLAIYKTTLYFRAIYEYELIRLQRKINTTESLIDQLMRSSLE